MTSPSGLALLDKPAGMSSFQALAPLKQTLGTRRVGHLGTLDRFADGLLPVLVGPCTRLAFLFEEQDKAYRAVLVLGKSTDTLDPEGRLIAEGPVPTLPVLQRSLPRFLGRIQQVPPEYSAVHVDGKRAYREARAGRRPQLAARTVSISALRILSYRPPELELEVDCSKGTYIRALARDLGREAGSCAFVSRLTRTRVGDFHLEEAVAPLDFLAAAHLQSPSAFLSRLHGVGSLVVEPARRADLLNGKPPAEGWFRSAAGASGWQAVFDEQGALLAVIRRQPDGYRYQAVFPEALP